MYEILIPSTIHVILLSFSGCFTKPSFDSFVALVVGWITCQGRHSISRVIQAAGELARGKHYTCFYRFLSRGCWAADALGQVVFQLLLRFLGTEITVIIDDTLSHRSGPHIFGAGMHHDASRSTYGRGTTAGRKVVFSFGHNWVILAIWIPLPWNTDRGLAVPILFRLYRPKKRCPETLYRKRTELALELVSLLAGWLPEGCDLKVDLVGDSEYACKTIVPNLPEGVVFTGPMCTNAALYAEPGPYCGRGRRRVKGGRLLSPLALAGSGTTPWAELTLVIYGKTVTILVKSQVCLWYTVARKKLVRMVVTRDPTGRIEDRTYFCTDARRSVADILIQFARRWEIEVAFRNAKQLMGVEDPQNGWWRRKAGSRAPKKKAGPNPRGRKGEGAVLHTLPLAFTAYAVLIVWYLRHGEPDLDVSRVRIEAPWYGHKDTPSFADILAAVRREIWASRFSAHPVFRRVRRKVRDLLPHWLLAA